MKLKKIIKSLTFLFIFGLVASYLIGVTLNVGAAESKYIDVISGTGRNFGDEVAIGDEHFYIISNNGEELKMLAKYNVDVSIMCTYNYDSHPTDGEKVGYSPDCGVRTNATKLQDSSITGIPDTKTGDVIGVPFSTSAKHGTTNVAYQGSVIQVYVDEYINEINKKYNINVSGELLSVQAFNKIFKLIDLNNIPSSVKKILNVSFWTMTPTQVQDTLMVVDATDQKYFSLKYDNFFGVRPVVIAPSSAVKYKEIEKSCDNGICFTDNDQDGNVSVSDEICIREECFYVFSNQNNEVKMLAKYNLNTGLMCEPGLAHETSKSTIHSMPCAEIGNVPLRQNISARGYIAPSGGTTTSYGGVNYNENDVNAKLEEYVAYLKTLVNANFKATLLTLDDITAVSGDKLNDYILKTTESNKNILINLPTTLLTGIGGTTYYLYYSRNVPDWLYGNSYWTKTTSGSDSMYAIMSDGIAADFEYATSGEFGIRPLITVPLENVPTSKKDIDDSSACYICGDEYVWTNSPDESSCMLQEDILEENSCVKNPKMGIDRYTIEILIIISLSLISLGILSKHNRFKRI